MAELDADRAQIPFASEPGFKSFPKHLAEDCVSYSIYLLSTTPSLPAPAVRRRLRTIQAAATAYNKTILKDYIWQRENFDLHIIEQSPEHHLHLEGRTCFGDSIADEWVIVYLLRELSRQFKDAWIRCEDADGEFLLVEAANVLPTWLEPDVGKNRVWINDGSLCILPRDIGQSSADDVRPGKKRQKIRDVKPVSLEQALDFISRAPQELIRSPTIEEEAFYRLRNYPAQISEIFHTARVTIPRNLAYVLHRTPAHVNPAVEAFYLRDPISLKVLQPGFASQIRFPPQDLVTTSVKFTRVDYAQVRSQEFVEPPAWEKAIEQSKSLAERDRLETGMKLTCGFEMLGADPQNQDKRSVREIGLLLDDVKSGEEPLPTDTEISSWGQHEDSEDWLDVNFNDFEDELSGRKGARKGGDRTAKGFGDKAAQDNLQRIVDRFQQLMKDDEEGGGNAFFDDDYNDLDSSSDDDDDDDDDPEEDKEVSYDEDDLAKAMREMMGLPTPKANTNATGIRPENRVQELDAGTNDEDDPEEMRKEMEGMEAELRAAGVLNLDNEQGSGASEDPKALLAKNFLESFKGQAGGAGPAGNFMSSLGLKLPPDKDDE
ncbi:MAG: hypothetical protein M1828_003597 [Chrysothrix sp. TS-e1954]|nr:MAG: hypothetical protein M1828_003597 [Chrysothrix sp. TS-e1954]